MPITNHYHEVLSFGENLVTFIIRQLQERQQYKNLTAILKEEGYPEAGNFKIPAEGEEAVRITFAEAKRMLKESGYDIGEDEMADIEYVSITPMLIIITTILLAILPPSTTHFKACKKTDIPPSTAQEKALGTLIHQKHSTDFYSIDKYPRALRPFYTHPDPSDPYLTNSYDFFMRGQEIMSGAQRLHNYDDLCAEMRSKGVDPLNEGFSHYTDAFKYGVSPHGGGGLGLNRIVQYFLGLNNIREATLFPRDPVRLAP